MPTARVAGRYAAGRGRAGLVALVEARERRQAGAKALDAVYTCTECPSYKAHSAAEFADHMRSHGALFAARTPATPSTSEGATSSTPAPIRAQATTSTAPSPSTTPSTTPTPAPHPATPASNTSTTRSTTTHSAAGLAVARQDRSHTVHPAISNFMKAGEQLAQMEPETAEDFELMLAGLAFAWTKAGDSVAEWAELLDADLRIDPAVTKPLYESAEVAGQLGKACADARARFRRVYEAHLEAAQSKARQVAKPGFFDAAA